MIRAADIAVTNKQALKPLNTTHAVQSCRHTPRWEGCHSAPGWGWNRQTLVRRGTTFLRAPPAYTYSKGHTELGPESSQSSPGT